MKYGWHENRGFTLIELMVTVALLAILLMMVAPLTSGWSDRNQVQSAKSSLKTAISQARVSAIRNTENKKSNEAAASVCIDSTNLTVNAYSITGSNTVCDNANNLLKTTAYANGISFKQGATAITCFVFSPDGILLSSGSCATTLDTITIKKNAEDDEIDAI